MAFAFVVGLFFGVFIIDFAHSVNLTAKIRAFAKKHDVVVSLEKLKESIKDKFEKKQKKASFIFPLKTENGLKAALESYHRNDEEEEREEVKC